MPSEQTLSVAVGTKSYKVRLVRDLAGGYTATVATLPGCITQGETLDDVLHMAKDAISCYLQAAQKLRSKEVH